MSGLTNYQTSYEKRRPTTKDMFGMQTTIHMAQEVGKELGRSEVL